MTAPKGNYQEVLDRIEKASHPDGEITVAQTLVSGKRDFPLLKIILGKGNPKRVLLSAGIHGDEPASVETLCRFLEQKLYIPFLDEWEFHILPCINPTGFELHTRENADNIDLNRLFRQNRPCTEVAYVQDALDSASFDLDLELHEDVDSPGYYLYQKETTEPPSPLGRWVLDAVAPVMPLNLDSEIEDMSAERGLLARLSGPDEMEWWPMAIYAIAQQCRRVFTMETSPQFSMDTRVQAHLKGVQIALERYGEASEIRP